MRQPTSYLGTSKKWEKRQQERRVKNWKGKEMIVDAEVNNRSNQGMERKNKCLKCFGGVKGKMMQIATRAPE
ncbi:hypothetical protein ACTXT7_002133 [Hymenolepis weldensis]